MNEGMEGGEDEAETVVCGAARVLAAAQNARCALLAP